MKTEASKFKRNKEKISIQRIHSSAAMIMAHPSVNKSGYIISKTKPYSNLTSWLLQKNLSD
jgi:hypothetical protein